jgi:type IV secretory pathway VirB2 component (pilin)
LFVFGVYLGVAIIINIDVNASLAAIDPANPNTWPEMGPQVRYFLVPVIGAILAVVAVCLNAIVGLFHRRDFHWAVWPILGVAYRHYAVCASFRPCHSHSNARQHDYCAPHCVSRSGYSDHLWEEKPQWRLTIQSSTLPSVAGRCAKRQRSAAHLRVRNAHVLPNSMLSLALVFNVRLGGWPYR